MIMRSSGALFYSAAIFNWIAAAVLFAPFGVAQRLALAPLPGDGLYEHIAVGAIAIFGLGYWWVARSPAANQGIVRLGIAGKLLVVAIVYVDAIFGAANLRMAALVSVDLLYAALFAQHLRVMRNHST
jgi:hypothetical protein